MLLDFCAAQFLLLLSFQCMATQVRNRKRSEELHKTGVVGLFFFFFFLLQPLKTLIVLLMTETVTIEVRPATASHLLTIQLPSPTLPCTSSLCQCDCHSSCFFKAVPGTLAMILCRVMTLIIQSAGPSGRYWSRSHDGSWQAGSWYFDGGDSGNVAVWQDKLEAFLCRFLVFSPHT